MSDLKVAFITGANRGIGFETALQLAKQNIHVVLGARNPLEGEKAAASLRSQNLKAEFLKFDAASPADAESCFQHFSKSFGKLDILVNNAGVFLDESDASQEHQNNTSTASDEMLRTSFEINFFSAVRLTQKLLPLILKSSAGRIVNVSSILGSLSLHADPEGFLKNSKYFCYDSSKTALNAFTVHLAQELRNTQVKVNSAHPGWVLTAMGGKSAMMSAEDGAKTSVQLATLKSDGPTGGFFHLKDSIPW
jgi:NAD(P)-dependent dehydrogenase (short-subunit alcohol dehydrogenase family)